MSTKLEKLLNKNLRVVPNFPIKGIMFQDIFSLIEKPQLLLSRAAQPKHVRRAVSPFVHLELLAVALLTVPAEWRYLARRRTANTAGGISAIPRFGWKSIAILEHRTTLLRGPPGAAILHRHTASDPDHGSKRALRTNRLMTGPGQPK